MDPVTVVVIAAAAYFLLQQSTTGQNALATALAKITSSSGSSAKPAGSAAPAGSSAAAIAAHAAAQNGTQTPQATIDALASDGNASDGQVAAYLQALNEGNTDLADAIIGDDAPVDTESDPDPTVDTGTIASTDVPVYQIPTVTYDGSDGGDSGDYGGDDGGDDGDDD